MSECLPAVKIPRMRYHEAPMPELLGRQWAPASGKGMESPHTALGNDDSIICSSRSMEGDEFNVEAGAKKRL
jgi:hypothetical protein